MVRLQKFLAEAGVASRRASEQLILDGRVSVNGQPVVLLGSKVDPARDTIALDGRALKTKRKLYIALHKPPFYVCTRKDELNRRTIHDLLPREWDNLYSVGRLDAESEGLIFLTNDGDFSLRLTHPRYGVKKKYIALVEGRVEASLLKKFTEGIRHEGELLKAEKAKLLSANNSHSEVELELAEGKNREVRRLFESIGLTVVRLARVQIGKIRIAELKAGKWRTLTETEIKSLLSPL
jgi:pseudouridine synthase